jgi:hypothetical protein
MEDKKTSGAKVDEQPKPVDILDDIKHAEAMVKKMVLIKVLSELKNLSRTILECKEKCNLLLSEAGISEVDAKRIIDFINAAQSVQLSQADKDKYQEWAKNKISGERKDVEKKMDEDFSMLFKNLGAVTSNHIVGANNLNGHSMMGSIGTGGYLGGGAFTTNVNDNIVLCSSGGNSLEVKI